MNLARIAASLICLHTTVSLAAEFPAFEHAEIDAGAADKAVYAVTLADVDGDQRQDIVAVTENRVQWYRNPDWDRHVILENQTELDNVCIAPHDIDGDGRIDFALGAGWTQIGTIQWITRGEDEGENWRVHSIGVEPWTHRMRWANVLGKDQPQLVVSPLNATDGTAGVRLLAFEIPDEPRTDPWPSTVLNDELNRMHNHWHVDFRNDGRHETIAAAQEGLFAIWRNDQGEFRSRQIGAGAGGDTPGAGEVKLGRLADDRRFMVTIEPMHGNMVVLYTRPQAWEQGRPADRLVLDDTLRQGHGVWPADLDGDGADEIVIGHREAGDGKIRGPGIYVFDAQDDEGREWIKHVIDDGGMACEDVFCADLNDDGRIDIVAGGRATKNVTIYWNQGPM